MKKAILILLVGLFWCNVGIAQNLIKIPVNVHIAQTSAKAKFNNKYYDYNTIATTQMIEKDFSKANEIWKQANIFWEIIKIDKTQINIKNFNKHSKFFINIRETKLNQRQLVKKSTLYFSKIIDSEKNNNSKAINVYYLPYMMAPACGYSTLAHKTKKHQDYFTLISSKVSPWYGQTRGCDTGWITAHELGHLLSLNHIGTAGIDLMMYHNKERKKGNRIPPNQIKQVRNFYKKNLKKIF